MYIKPTKEAKGSIFDIHEDADSILLYPVDDDIPAPWDADITIEGDKVIIEGSIFGGSFADYKHAGYCHCEISIDKFPKAYRVEVPGFEESELAQALFAAGWIKA